MLGNVALWFVLAALSLLLGWLTWRTRRLKNAATRWGSVAISGLLTLILALATVAAGRGLFLFYAPRNAPVPSITLDNTPQQIARGAHLALPACGSCHSPNLQLPLVGGVDIGKKSPIPIGGIISVNLTPAGPLKDWSDSEIFRTLRRGVDRQGRPLITMGAMSTRFLSDDDLKAIIAYVRSQPAVKSTTREGDFPNLLLAIFAGANLLPAPPSAPDSISSPPKAVSAEYGRYIITFSGCSDCHGTDLQGGKGGGLSPAGPSLEGVKGWTQAQFISTLRNGVNPSGQPLGNKMPWPSYGQFEDIELGAVYQYLRTLP